MLASLFMSKSSKCPRRAVIPRAGFCVKGGANRLAFLLWKTFLLSQEDYS
jgi:hypothetical protein